MQAVVKDSIKFVEEALPTRNSRLVAAGAGVVGAYLLSKKLFGGPHHLPSDGKVVLVTGCDTEAGFGTATVKKLHELGYVVFAGCLDAKTAETGLYAEFKESNRFHVVQMDVCNQEQIDECVKIVEEWLKANPKHYFHSVVNNAGIGIFSPIEWFNMDAFIKVFDVNCFGVVRVTKSFLHLLRTGSKDGRVVVMASLAADIATANASPYTGSKAAIAMISDCLREECQRFGIKVSVICPDFYRTNIVNPEANAAVFEKQAKTVPKEIFEAYGGPRKLEHFRKSTGRKLYDMAKPDLSPVVNCVVDGIASTDPQWKYYPIEFPSRVARYLSYNYPEVYGALKSKLLGIKQQ